MTCPNEGKPGMLPFFQAIEIFEGTGAARYMPFVPRPCFCHFSTSALVDFLIYSQRIDRDIRVEKVDCPTVCKPKPRPVRVSDVRRNDVDNLANSVFVWVEFVDDTLPI